MSRVTLAYIVTEAGCMDPTTGAYQHIKAGTRELAKHAELIEFLPPKPAVGTGASPGRISGKASSLLIHKPLLRGTVRDIRDLITVLVRDLYVAHQAWRSKVDAVYFRMDFPSFIPILMRLLGITVFIEANGIRHLQRKLQSRSIFEFLYEPIERYTYRLANHTFFVGSLGHYWNLPSDSWTNVENGVEPELFEQRKQPAGEGETLKLVLVARLMAHHRGSLLSESIKLLEPSQRVRLEVHFVGSGFDDMKRELTGICSFVDHGFVARDSIGALLREMDCGVIPDCPPYASQMKLLDYAACGCLVLAPNVSHIKNFYADKGVLFFERNEAASLAARLKELISGEVPVDDMSRSLQDHVREHFTWPAIFERKWARVAEESRDA